MLSESVVSLVSIGALLLFCILVRECMKRRLRSLILGKGAEFFIHVSSQPGRSVREQCLEALFPDSGLRLVETRLMRSVTFPGTAVPRMVGVLISCRLGLKWVVYFAEGEDAVAMAFLPASPGWHAREIMPEFHTSFPLP